MNAKLFPLLIENIFMVSILLALKTSKKRNDQMQFYYILKIQMEQRKMKMEKVKGTRIMEKRKGKKQNRKKQSLKRKI